MDKQLVESIIKNLRQWVKGWENIQETQLNFKRLTGITNRTYCVSHNSEEIQPKKILLRVFGGDVEDIFIDRNDELLVYEAAAKYDLGPSIYGETRQMRAEQWIESRVLKQSEMNSPYSRRKVALLLNKFHKQKVEGIHDQPLPLKFLDDQVAIKAAKDKIKQDVQKFEKEELQKIDEMAQFWFNNDENNFMKNHLPKTQESIVFSHNDLLANNVLIDAQNKFFFIDFEYACYNYRSHDIANYFIETQFDYDVEQPPYFHLEKEMINLDDVKDFVKYYALGNQQDLHELTLEQEDKLINDEEYLQKLILNKEQYNQEVESIMKEIPLFLLFANYFWAVWGIVMSKNPEIDFDYIEFSYQRLKKYQSIKKAYF